MDRQSHIYKCTLVRHETKQQTKARHWARVKMYHASLRQDPGTLLSSLGGRGRIILGWDLDFDRIMGGQRQTLSRQTHGCNFLKDSSVFVCWICLFVCCISLCVGNQNNLLLSPVRWIWVVGKPAWLSPLSFLIISWEGSVRATLLLPSKYFF